MCSCVYCVCPCVCLYLFARVSACICFSCVCSCVCVSMCVYACVCVSCLRLCVSICVCLCLGSVWACACVCMHVRPLCYLVPPACFVCMCVSMHMSYANLSCFTWDKKSTGMLIIFGSASHLGWQAEALGIREGIISLPASRLVEGSTSWATWSRSAGAFSLAYPPKFKVKPPGSMAY